MHQVRLTAINADKIEDRIAAHRCLLVAAWIALSQVGGAS